MPDRFADAVRARRHELRAELALLTPARADLRDALAAARATALAQAAADLADVRRTLDGHPAGAVAAAARAVAVAACADWSERAVAAERGTAADRGLALPAPPDDPPPPPVPDPSPPRRTRAVEALADAGTWRLAVLPLAVAPLSGVAGLSGFAGLPGFAGLSGFAGPSVLLPAAGAAALVLVAVVRSRRAAADRARLHRWGTDLLAAAHARLDAELTRRTAARTTAAGARLDAALARRRAEVGAELALLTPAREAVDVP